MEFNTHIIATPVSANTASHIFANPRKPRIPKFLRRGKGWLGLIATAAIAATGLDVDDSEEPSSDQIPTKSMQEDFVKNRSVSGGLSQWWDSLWAGHMQDKANYLQSHNLMPGGSATGQAVAPMVIPTEPVSGEITIKIDAGELRNMIDQQIETANMDNINLILAVPQ